MNENMAAFIAELRTTGKPQTQGDLRNEEGFCCLGIACEMAIESELPGLRRHQGDSGYDYQLPGGLMEWVTEISFLPNNVAHWLGAGMSNPLLKVPQHVINALSLEQAAKLEPRVTSAVKLNDTAGLTFAQIADCFEATFGDEQVTQ